MLQNLLEKDTAGRETENFRKDVETLKRLKVISRTENAISEMKIHWSIKVNKTIQKSLELISIRNYTNYREEKIKKKK